MPRFVVVVILAVLGAGRSMPLAAEPADAKLRAAVVKVFSTSQSVNEGEPWKAGAVSSSSGSGFVIEGRRILTAAHCVERTTFLQVRRLGDVRRFEARVLFASHETDLALLTVDEPAFFDGLEPIALGPLPPVESEVAVMGYPVGGDTLSVTKGILARVETQPYAQGGGSFLAGQIDAAVNPGNSGGPVLAAGRAVGVAFQSYAGGSNTSYFVPTPLVERFLADVGDGTYDGVQDLGIRVEKVESTALSRQLGLAFDSGGVVVREVGVGCASDGALEPRDVIVAVDGQAVAGDGTLALGTNARAYFTHQAAVRQRGDFVSLTVVRRGARREVSVLLRSSFGQCDLVAPVDRVGRPSYLVFGGFQLRHLTKAFLLMWGEEWPLNAPQRFVVAAERLTRFAGEEVVVLCPPMADRVNDGYPGWYRIVETIDGRAVRNLRHAAELLENGQEAFVVFGLAGSSEVVLERALVAERHATILERYQVTSDRSPDLVRLPADSSSADAFGNEAAASAPVDSKGPNGWRQAPLPGGSHRGR